MNRDDASARHDRIARYRTLNAKFDEYTLEKSWHVAPGGGTRPSGGKAHHATNHAALQPLGSAQARPRTAEPPPEPRRYGASPQYRGAQCVQARRSVGGEERVDGVQ